MVEFYDRIFRNSPNVQMSITYYDDENVEHEITNRDICSEEMSLDEALCSDDNLIFGTCESSCFYVRVANQEISLKGRMINVMMKLRNTTNYIITADEERIIDSDEDTLTYSDSDSTETLYIPYGRFRVISDKPTADRVWRDLYCYDIMHDLMDTNVIEWYKAQTFPMSIKTMRDSLFTYLDITQESATLVNDDYIVTGDFEAGAELSAITIIQAVCELNGVFGHINRHGNFTYISLPSDESIRYAFYVNGSGEYEDYLTANITGITAKGEEGDVGTIVGTDTNMYKIQSNPLTFGKEGSPELILALNKLLNMISQISYRPFRITTYGNPMLQVGTNLTFVTRNQTINSFIMKRTLRGIQALRDDFVTSGDEKYPEFASFIKNEITRLNGKTHILRNDVNTLDSEINDESTGIKSQLQQTNEEIVMKVDSDGNMVQVQLGVDKDDPSATTFKAGADNISFIANDTIELTSNDIAINSTNFQVTKDGDLTCNNAYMTNADVSGTVRASVGNIGGWNISADRIYSTNEYSSLYTNYGGTNKGALEFKNANLSGGISLDVLGLSTWKISGAAISYSIIEVGSSIGLRAETLSISGSKSRVVTTEDYGERLLYCYETPTPMFADVGEGKIAEDGKCYVWLDPIFTQTIENITYQVFLQKYGQGECYVSERKSNYFVVEGDIGLLFGWEIKAKQKDYAEYRLDNSEIHKQFADNEDYGSLGIEHISIIQSEREVA